MKSGKTRLNDFQSGTKEQLENQMKAPEAKHDKSEINRGTSSSKEEPRGFEIAGWPWQVVYAFVVLTLSVLVVALKLIGVI